MFNRGDRVVFYEPTSGVMLSGEFIRVLDDKPNIAVVKVDNDELNYLLYINYLSLESSQ